MSILFPGDKILSPETELIFELCRTRLDSGRSHAARLLRAGLNWDAFLNRVAGWQLDPLVLNTLLAVPEGLPPSVVGRVRIQERESRTIALSRTLTLVDLLTRLERAGIPAILLKGPATAIAAYGDPSMRMFGDADILVKPESIGATRRLLMSLDFAPDYPLAAESGLVADQHALEFSSPRQKVDLHSALVSRYLRFHVAPHDIWNLSVFLPCAGREVRSLAPEIHLLFLCVHGAKHGWVAPRWICDVAFLVRKLKPAAIARAYEAADRSHSRLILETGLELASQLFGAPAALRHREPSVFRARALAIAAPVVGQIRSTGDQAAPDQQWFYRLDPAIAPLIFWAKSRERRIDRIACVAAGFLVPPGGARRSPVTWLTRPLRLMTRGIRRMRL